MKFNGFIRGKFFELGILLLTGIFYWLILFQRNKKGSVVEKYLSDLSMNTDSIKFDEALRMVIDVGPKQIDEIYKMLRENKNIFFGLHAANEALMTCFMQSMENHIHFVDGGDGGYAMAAKELKKMMLASSQISENPKTV